MHDPIHLVSVISTAVYRLWSIAHAKTGRGHRTCNILIIRTYPVPSPVANLDLPGSPFAAPESILSYTKPKYRLGFAHVSVSVSVSVSFSYAHDLVVEHSVSTSPISTLDYYNYSLVPTPTYPASFSFGPTRTPVDTCLTLFRRRVASL
jgi:hypothetical protein